MKVIIEATEPTQVDIMDEGNEIIDARAMAAGDRVGFEVIEGQCLIVHSMNPAELEGQPQTGR